MSTNRVAIGPIRAILCAHKAMFLGYILGRFRALGKPKKSEKSPPKVFPDNGINHQKYFVYVLFCPLSKAKKRGLTTRRFQHGACTCPNIGRLWQGVGGPPRGAFSAYM